MAYRLLIDNVQLIQNERNYQKSPAYRLKSFLNISLKKR